eukprot:g46788.t1
MAGLLLLLVLVCAASANPAAEEGLAASPSAREPEPESGRMGLEDLEKSGLQLEESGTEQHQESYSTFAAEFFETRYWGDEDGSRVLILFRDFTLDQGEEAPFLVADTPTLDEQIDYTANVWPNVVSLLTKREKDKSGYAFPSPPPVDPFAKIRVDDCGKTKGCF